MHRREFFKDSIIQSTFPQLLIPRNIKIVNLFFIHASKKRRQESFVIESIVENRVSRWEKSVFFNILVVFPSSSLPDSIISSSLTAQSAQPPQSSQLISELNEQALNPYSSPVEKGKEKLRTKRTQGYPSLPLPRLTISNFIPALSSNAVCDS